MSTYHDNLHDTVKPEGPTIPIAIRKALGRHAGNHVTVHQQDHNVVLENASQALRSTAGIFARYPRATLPTPEEAQEAVELAVAEEYVSSLADEAADRDT